ncbi:hypothetical protein THAOC_24942, partial [Thalassiosira oceanica]
RASHNCARKATGWRMARPASMSMATAKLATGIGGIGREIEIGVVGCWERPESAGEGTVGRPCSLVGGLGFLLELIIIAVNKLLPASGLLVLSAVLHVAAGPGDQGEAAGPVEGAHTQVS